MAIAETSRRVNANPVLVWEIVADMHGDAGPPPAAERIDHIEGSGTDLRRTLSDGEGRVWEERCVGWEPGRLYSMALAGGEFPLPVAALRYTCSVSEEAGSVLVRLYFDYQPRFGLLGRLMEHFGLQRRLTALGAAVLDNWVRIIHAREWAYRVTVRKIIEDKGGHVHAVQPDTPLRTVAAQLSEHRIGSVLVLESDGRIAGVVSERDIVRNLAELGGSLLDEPAGRIMTREVVTAGPEDNMMSVMACMSERRVRHLPVVSGDAVLGLISIGDVIKARITELEGESETLLDYIEARRWHEAYKEIGPAAYSES